MFSHLDTFIIDVQFVVGNHGTHFIKELAILPINGVVPYYCLFKSPFPFVKLRKSAQYQNLYNLRFINNLDWYCGTTDYAKIKSTLMPFQNSTIIVKGKQKKDALAPFFPNKSIEDLDEDFSLSSLRDFLHNCPHHESTFSQCCINNVFKIRTWLEKNDLIY